MSKLGYSDSQRFFRCSLEDGRTMVRVIVSWGEKDPNKILAYLRTNMSNIVSYEEIDSSDITPDEEKHLEKFY